LLLLAILTTLAGCAGRIAPPDQRGVLPLRTVWMRQLQPQWREDLFRPMQYSSPAVSDGVVYMGDDQNIFWAFKAADGAVLWKFGSYGPVECTPVVVENLVIFGDGDGYVYALDRRTGFVKWTYRVQGQVMGRLITDGKLVFVRTNHERLYAVTVADGKWKWMQSRELPSGFTIRGVSSPTLDGDRVLNGFADGYLLAFNKNSGTEVFKTMLEKGERFVDIDSTPIVDGNSIYVASYSGSVYALSRENAAVQWVFNHGSVQRVAIVGDRLFVSDNEGFARALDKANGHELWSFDLREYDEKQSLYEDSRRKLVAPTNPVPYHDLLLIGSSNGFLYALDQRDGRLRWQFWPGFGMTAETIVDGDAIYMHTNFGNLYCLKPNLEYGLK
jgi:outer membrane protein assembly factor BamB